MNNQNNTNKVKTQRIASQQPKLRFPEFTGDWEEKKLGEISKSYSGGTPSTTEKKYYNGNIPFIRSAEIGKYYSELFLTSEGLNNSSAKLVNKGDVLVALYGANSGDVAIAKINGAINQAILCLKFEDCNEFVYQFLTLKKEWIISTYLQGGQGNLSGQIIKSVSLPFPSKAEQQKIAGCLSSIDERIEAEKQKLQALKKHKKGLMQQLFPAQGKVKTGHALSQQPKLRFKGFKGDWEEKKLGDVADIKGRIGYRGYTTDDIVSKGEGAISLSPTNITGESVLNFDKNTYISWFKYNESPEIMLEDGYTVLVKTGSSFGKAAFVMNLPERTTINPQIVVIKPQNINELFLFLLVSNYSIQRQINETVVGGAIPTLSQKSMLKFDILIPTIKEQQKIASCLSSLDEIIELQGKKIEKLQEHKKGLMQQMFPNPE